MILLLGTGSLTVRAESTDTEPHGYVVPLPEGGPDLHFANTPLAEAVVVLSWEDGAEREQEPLDFTLCVSAIDASGNESAPTCVDVFDPGREASGCDAGRTPPTFAGAALLLLALARRRAG